MRRIVSRKFVVEYVNQLYINQENYCCFCQNSSCKHCWATYLFDWELRIKKFNRDNSTVKR